ncbi:MAG TPA: PIN domain-containing protein [Longimicrobium sp.]
MRYLVDTNVFSEPTKPRPNPAVLEWVASQPADSTAVSAISLGEAQKGIALLEYGKRRAMLQQWLTLAMREQFGGRVLAVTKHVALAWGNITAADQKRGRVLQPPDGILLATAAVHGLRSSPGTSATSKIAACPS